MKFSIDEALKGLKRGAEKFGTKVAAKLVTRKTRTNGFTPQEPEPYGAGMGGAETGQDSRQNSKFRVVKAPGGWEIVTSDGGHGGEIFEERAAADAQCAALNGSKENAVSHDTKDPKCICGEHAREYKEDCPLSQAAENKNDDGGIAESGLGYDSAERSTTTDAGMGIDAICQCPACGFASVDEWMGKCPSCGMRNEKPVGLRKPENSEPSEKANGQGATCTKCGEWSDDAYKDPTGAGFLCGKCANSSSEVKNADAKDVELEKEDYPHDAGEDGRKEDRAIEEKKNAGHLGPDAWEAATDLERTGWLEAASQDLALLHHKWVDLSLDSQVALQDAFDMPKSINSESGGAAAAEHGAPSIESVEADLGGTALSNADGKPGRKKFVFKDVQGEEETIEATSLDQAWDQLANIFGESPETLKKVGVKFIRENSAPCRKCGGKVDTAMVCSSCGTNFGPTNSLDNSESLCPECKHPQSQHGNGCDLCECSATPESMKNADTGTGEEARVQEYTKAHEAGEHKSPAGGCPMCELKNDAPGDVAEIERHVEGIEHELGEMKEEVSRHNTSGVARGSNKYGTVENAEGDSFKPGDKIEVRLSDNTYKGKVVKMISSDVVEVEYVAPSSGVLRTDRYYTSQVHKA